MPVDSLSQHPRRGPKMLLLDHRRRARRADCLAVSAQIDLAANPPDFINHPQAVARVIARSVQWPPSTVVPTHGNFAETQPCQMRQVDQFNVEAKAINLRRFKQRPAHIQAERDRKSTRLNSSHMSTSYAVFCLKKKK